MHHVAQRLPTDVPAQRAQSTPAAVPAPAPVTVQATIDGDGHSGAAGGAAHGAGLPDARPVTGKNGPPSTAGPLVDGDDPHSEGDTQPDDDGASPRPTEPDNTMVVEGAQAQPAVPEQSIARRRSSSRDSQSEQSNKANNVRLAVSDNENIVNTGVPNALVATKTLKKGDVVIEETVPGSSDLAGLAQHVEDSDLPYPTLQHGEYWAALAGLDGAKSLAYMANHDPNPNCDASMPSQWRRNSTCTVRFTATRQIQAGDEITHAYNKGDKSNPPVFPDPTSTQKPPPAKAAQSSGQGSSTSTSKSLRAPQANGKSGNRHSKKVTLDDTCFHPTQGKMTVNTAPKNGNCFFTSVARQLSAADVPVPGKPKGRWGQKMLRLWVSGLMTNPQTAAEQAAVSEARTDLDAFQRALGPENEPELFDTSNKKNPKPLTWADVADDIKDDFVWVNPTIIQLVISLLKIDLCYMRVCISKDGKVDTQPWVYQKYSGSQPTVVNGKRIVVHLRYTDDFRDGTGHYDSWVPAGTNDDSEPEASAALLSEDALGAMRADQAAKSGPETSRKRKPSGAAQPGGTVTRRKGKGKGKA
jgi:hypothetical protein